ncbi:hypothetical protein [Chelatococcus sp.]|uniref:hypothetical protein n=1 Tax=Chelatococcus sp. TaxID=1953771 RepID=UPI001ED17E63|nr:hypothetical protein [Chelatococcus sp.]MBX3545605.1 hypothetical protein [Chelatococcus sp.]
MSGSNRPQKPLESYPLAEIDEMPVVPDVDPVATPAAPAPEPTLGEMAVLDFIDPAALSKSVPLRHAFRLDGETIGAIQVRRLAVAEVGQLAASIIQKGRYDVYDVYALMTGLPAAVVRALPDDDGDAVIDACSPFLPRFAQETESPSEPTSGNGDGTPSSPAGA